ncbi:hypothetical protein [Anaerovibrio lipolyticus]|jgi:hypothetical protein|uniref:hypothetical protein n=1 Tax=Anaerovibrio lipolyticus TaxID=82374 RepID=UPI0025DEF29C|nr:hypothetical protein [Anaerovibrio lipolyticus]
MVKQAKRYQEFLEKNNIEGFVVKELHDEADSVMFCSNILVNGRRLSMAVIIDKSIYTIIRVNLAPLAVTEDNMFEITNLMLRLNGGNKALKYYLAADASIMLDCCIPAFPGQFSPKLVHSMLQLVYGEVMKNYGEFASYL